jgi:hypothetical protein
VKTAFFTSSETDQSSTLISKKLFDHGKLGDISHSSITVVIFLRTVNNASSKSSFDTEGEEFVRNLKIDILKGLFLYSSSHQLLRDFFTIPQFDINFSLERKSS